MDELFTRAEAAKMLKVSKSTLARIIWQKEIQHRIIGKRAMFKQEDIEDYIERNKVTVRPRQIIINRGEPEQRRPGRPPQMTNTGYVPGMKVV